MLAKPVVKNKFWVVKGDEGEQIATIQKLTHSKGVVLVSNGGRKKYPSISVLGKEHNIKIGRTVAKPTASSADVHGFPADGDIFNVVFDVSKGLPLYTKLEASKSFFCAGYYIINFNGSCVKNFSPKLLTLDRNDYEGPFHTEDEMKARLEEIRK